MLYLPLIKCSRSKRELLNGQRRLNIGQMDTSLLNLTATAKFILASIRLLISPPLASHERMERMRLIHLMSKLNHWPVTSGQAARDHLSFLGTTWSTFVFRFWRKLLDMKAICLCNLFHWTFRSVEQNSTSSVLSTWKCINNRWPFGHFIFPVSTSSF